MNYFSPQDVFEHIYLGFAFSYKIAFNCIYIRYVVVLGSQ